MPSIATKELSKALLSGPADHSHLPDWFREQQQAAWTKFEALPTPNRRAS